MRAVLRGHDVVELLTCPRCRAAVALDGEGNLRGSNMQCSIAASTFPQIGGQPVMVDASLIQRGSAGRARALAARLSGGRNVVAERRAREIAGNAGRRIEPVLLWQEGCRRARTFPHAGVLSRRRSCRQSASTREPVMFHMRSERTGNVRTSRRVDRRCEKVPVIPLPC